MVRDGIEFRQMADGARGFLPLAHLLIGSAALVAVAAGIALGHTAMFAL